MHKSITEEEIYKKVFEAYTYGNLGLFIGAGMSKAIMNEEGKKALNWFELIDACSEKLELDMPKNEDLIGVSLPELATRLCKSLSLKEGISYEEAKQKFKREICSLTSWVPNPDNQDNFKEIINKIAPKWIITTNYDLILESIMTGKYKSIGPYNYLSSPKDLIPIYHIHGTRLEPSSIIITLEDYVPLFRPSEYRQSKLAMTIRESTTVVLGYSLGDINILSALDWSKNIYNGNDEYPHAIIQVIRVEGEPNTPYIDDSGNIILEITDLKDFLVKLGEYLLEETERHQEHLKELDEVLNILDSDISLEDEFIQSSKMRVELLQLVSEFEHYMIEGYIEFLNRCMSKVRQERYAYKDFKKCDQLIKIILDILINYDFRKMPPKLFREIAEELNEVLYHIEENADILYTNGNSWRATETWHKRKREIPIEMKSELLNYFTQNNFRNKGYLEFD